MNERQKQKQKTTSTEYLIEFILITKKNRTICSSQYASEASSLWLKVYIGFSSHGIY